MLRIVFKSKTIQRKKLLYNVQSMDYSISVLCANAVLEGIMSNETEVKE